MKLLGKLLLLGVLLSMLRSALATVFPSYLCPDFGLLLAAGMGYRLRAVRGLWMAALLGYCVDLLSATLLGEHAVIYTIVFLLMYLGNRQIHLWGAMRLALAAALLSVLHGFLLIWMSHLFHDRSLFSLALNGGWWIQVLVNAAVAPWFIGRVAQLSLDRDGDSNLQRPQGFRPREVV
jgi:rod shape-determining protein MreD